MLIAVNFHYVRPVFDAPHPGIHGITPGRFEEQLKLLSQAGTFVSAADILAAVRGEKPLPDSALVVTFDDGLREQYEHAVPVLSRLGVPAIFFVNTGPIAAGAVSAVHKIHLLRANVAPAEFVDRLQAEARARNIPFDANRSTTEAVVHYKYDDLDAARIKYLINFVLKPADRDRLVDALFDDVFDRREAEISRQLYMDRHQIAELGRREWIGSHGHEHLPLGLLARDQVERQLGESAALLEDWTGRRPFALSYPYGSKDASSREVAAVAARTGIEFAFTMERAGNANLRGPLHLARFDNNDLPGGKAARYEIDELFTGVSSRTWYAN